MGKKRWEGTTAKQRQEYARKLSAIRLKKLSREERSEIARAAVKARWEKWRAEHPEGRDNAKAQGGAHGAKPSTREQKQTRGRKRTLNGGLVPRHQIRT
jgi:hypothetical protein